MAERLGVSPKTLQRWDNDGKLKAYRTPTNRRYYTEEQLNEYFENDTSNKKRKIVAYIRVSNRNQQDELNNQIEFIKRHINGHDEVVDNKVERIYITYKDRFIRFGYEWFEQLCEKFDTEIIVLNDKNMSSMEELIDDLSSIIHVFSTRIDGLKRYKKQVKEDDNLQSVQNRD